MIFIEVIEIVFPVFFLSLLGFFWVKKGFEYPMQFVTRLCMNLAVPCLVFVSLMNTEINIKLLFNFTLATLFTYTLIIITFFVIIKLIKINSKTYLAPLSFGNTGNIGLPLAYFAFGETGLGYAVLVLSIIDIKLPSLLPSTVSIISRLPLVDESISITEVLENLMGDLSFGKLFF